MTVAGYTLGRLLGRGGMSDVYAASHPTLGERLALKLLRPELTADEAVRTAFLAEATRRVHHPNVIRIHDAGRDPTTGQCYVAMDRIEGEDLAARLRAHPLSEDEARAIFAAIADGMHAVHAAGIVHRDLKPANVMLRGAVPLVVDFGIAKSLGSMSALATSRRIGTPAYMAPEQLTGGLIAPCVDVWALGVMMFEAVTGTLPFDDFAEGRAPQLFETAPRVLSRARVSPALDHLVARCLERDPSKRARSMDAIARELRGDADLEAERVTQDAGALLPPAPVAALVAGSSGVGSISGAPIAGVSISGDASGGGAPSGGDRSRGGGARVGDGPTPQRDTRGGAAFGDASIRGAPISGVSRGDALASSAARTGMPSSGAPRASRRRWAWAASAILLIGALVGALALGGRGEIQPSAVAAAPDASSVSGFRPIKGSEQDSGASEGSSVSGFRPIKGSEQDSGAAAGSSVSGFRPIKGSEQDSAAREGSSVSGFRPIKGSEQDSGASEGSSVSGFRPIKGSEQDSAAREGSSVSGFRPIKGSEQDSAAREGSSVSGFRPIKGSEQDSGASDGSGVSGFRPIKGSEQDSGRISVEVRSKPAGAQILLGGRSLGVTPKRLELRSPASLVVRRAGYRSARVRADKAGALDVRLVPLATKPRESLD